MLIETRSSQNIWANTKLHYLYNQMFISLNSFKLEVSKIKFNTLVIFSNQYQVKKIFIYLSECGIFASRSILPIFLLDFQYLLQHLQSRSPFHFSDSILAWFKDGVCAWFWGKASKKRELTKKEKEAIRAFENMGFLKEKKVWFFTIFQSFNLLTDFRLIPVRLVLHAVTKECVRSKTSCVFAAMRSTFTCQSLWQSTSTALISLVNVLVAKVRFQSVSTMTLLLRKLIIF